MSSFSILEIHTVMFHLYVHLKLQASQPGYPVPLRSILWNLIKVDTIQNSCSVGYNWTRRLEITIIDKLRSYVHIVMQFSRLPFSGPAAQRIPAPIWQISQICVEARSNILQATFLNRTKIRSIRSVRKQNLLTNLLWVCKTSVNRTSYNFDNTRQLKDTIPNELHVSN